MTLKSIEMQIALPRTQDAGKIQDQIGKEGQRFQDALTNDQLKELVKKRKSVNKFDEMSKSKNEKNPFEDKNKSEIKKDKKVKKTKESTESHPYLGNQFDYSG